MSDSKSQPTPEALAAALLAVRDGDTSSIETWAAEVEAAGDPEAARLIRDFPGLRDNISEHLTESRVLWPEVAVYLRHDEVRSYWFLGDSEMSESTPQHPNRWPHMMGQLLIHWNRYHPGVEWLARQLQLTRIQVEDAPHVELLDGQHLTPLPPGEEPGYLVLEPAVPPASPKAVAPGKCLKCEGSKSVTCEACGGKAYFEVNGEEQECVRCECMGFHTCPVCNGSGKLKPKRVPKSKTNAKKGTAKRTPAAKAKPKPPAKKPKAGE
jgi:hypothetical protein